MLSNSSASVTPSRPIGGTRSLSCNVSTSDLRAGIDLRYAHDLRRADLRRIEPKLLQRLAGRDVRVRGDLADPQMVILEHLEAALLLHAVMHRVGAPADHRFLIGPG